MIAGARDLAGDLELRVRQFAGELVEVVEYVREFQGAPLPEGRKSVTFRIVAGRTTEPCPRRKSPRFMTASSAGLTELGYEFRA